MVYSGFMRQVLFMNLCGEVARGIGEIKTYPNMRWYFFNYYVLFLLWFSLGN